MINGGLNRKLDNPDRPYNQPVISKLSARNVLRLSAKLNFKAVGGRLGKYTNKAAKIIESMTSDEIWGWKSGGFIRFTVGDDDELTYEIVNPENEMLCEK